MKPTIDIIRNSFHLFLSIPIMYSFNLSAEFYLFTSPIIATLIMSNFFGFGSGILWENFGKWAVKAKVSKTDIYLTALGFNIGGFLVFLNPNLTWLDRYVTPICLLAIVLEAIRILRIKYKGIN